VSVCACARQSVPDRCCICTRIRAWLFDVYVVAVLPARHCALGHACCLSIYQHQYTYHIININLIHLQIINLNPTCSASPCSRYIREFTLLKVHVCILSLVMRSMVMRSMVMRSMVMRSLCRRRPGPRIIRNDAPWSIVPNNIKPSHTHSLSLYLSRCLSRWCPRTRGAWRAGRGAQGARRSGSRAR
jgi:hypothetical protein